mmetsp:Transcript_63443/g.71035  ORF Transcript_63443/g.71035 Transcript_63443/m.71035 type:complete len:90 (-) Transcript_63443:82-351(-)
MDDTGERNSLLSCDRSSHKPRGGGANSRGCPPSCYSGGDHPLHLCRGSPRNNSVDAVAYRCQSAPFPPIPQGRDRSDTLLVPANQRRKK